MEMIQAPASVLRAPELSATAKVVWLAALWVDDCQRAAAHTDDGDLLAPAPGTHSRSDSPVPTAGALSPARLQAAGGVARGTVRRALAEMTATGWLHPTEGLRRPAWPASGRTVGIPPELLALPQVGPHAKILYGLVQLTKGFTGKQTSVRYTELMDLTQTSLNTVKQAVTELQEAGWLQVSQERRTLPLHLVLLNPVRYREKLELAITKREVANGRSKGEGLMRGFLSLLVASDLFEDDAEPGFLVNPVTGEHLQFDRFYPPGVAFEFNGAQHYGTTDWFPSSDEAEDQRLRDLIKAGICFYRGITLVVVHAEDLSLEGIRRKVGNLLPLRDLNGHERRTRYLEKTAFHYRNKALTQTPE